MSKYKELFSPITVGGVRIKNRIMMSAMDTNYGNADGSMSERLHAYLVERARGGVGLITIEAASVSYPEGRIGAYSVQMADRNQTARWIDTVRAIHAFGAKVLIQLHHGGMQAVPAFSGGAENVCASDYDFYGVFHGREMTLQEIEKVKNDFIQAAVNARMTGADGIEIHAAHQYLINTFLSPLVNRRTDAYGGTLENRGRLLREIVEGIREACPRPFIVGVRLAVQDYAPNGQTIEEGAYFAKMCEDAGADMINATTGFSYLPGYVIETQFQPEGHRLYLGKAMKEAVSIPVAVVGKLRTASVCNDAIRDKMTDIVALGRQLICDPAWPNKNLFGKEDSIRPCLSCNAGCVNGYSTSSVQCVLNPYVSREQYTREETVEKSNTPKKITVIGGGVAGMQFAVIAKKRGHDVTIIEREDALGGQMNLAAVPPHKMDVAKARDWFISEVKRQNIPVRLGHQYSAEELAAMGSDLYVVATGAKQRVPSIPGIENAEGTWKVLDGAVEVKPGMHVTMIGGGAVSCETAEMLIEKGCTVTVLEVLPELMRGCDESHKILINMELQQSGRFTSYCSAQVEYIAKNEVTFTVNGESQSLKSDLILYSTGNCPQTEVYEKLIDLDCETYLIGDAGAPGDLRTSTRSAYELAYSL